MKRTSCIYSEMTNPGLGRYRRVKGVGLVPVKKFRFTNYANCRLWLDRMLTLYSED